MDRAHAIPAAVLRRALPFLLTIVFGCSLGVLGTCYVAAGEEVMIDGVIHVRNTAEPPGGVQTLELAEQWRAGGEDDEVFFGVIAQVLTDDRGHIYVMDSQLSEVHVFSATGEHLRILSREGEGPGEIRQPSDMFFLPDGTLAMVQSFPGKIIKIDLEGNPAGSMQLSGTDPSQGRFGVLNSGYCASNTIVLVGFHMAWDQTQGIMNQNLFLSRCDESGKELHLYHGKEYPIVPANFVLEEDGFDFIWGRVDLGRDGRLYVATERNEYRIEVHTPDGTVERVIEREFESWPRTKQQKKAARLNLEAVGHYYPYALQGVTIEDTEPDISGVHLRDDGSLWVSNSRDLANLPEGIMASFDVYDPAGHFTHKVHIAGEGDPDRDAMYLVDDQHLVQVTGATDAWRSSQAVNQEAEDPAAEEEIALELICYQVSR
jgi:hypothetical protein